MIDANFDGRPFTDAVATGFGTDLPALWTAFLAGSDRAAAPGRGDG